MHFGTGFSMDEAIKVNSLVMQFGKFRAVDGISFSVNKGEIFGLLGPNGAGKTTTIKMLTTLLKPTSGNAYVAGFDIVSDSNDVRKNIGIVFQDPSLDDELTGRENLDFHAILYNIEKNQRDKKISQILKLIELEDKADDLVKNYSGGMKRRLEIGRGLIHEPKVLFLDEPTIGLDAQTRRHIWDYIKKLNSVHKITIILTTHYIEEADYLADRVAFVDHGKIVALDTPRALKDKLGGDIISMQVQTGLASLEKGLKPLKWIKAASTHDGRIDLTVDEGEHQIPRLILIAEKHNATISSIELHTPSLEDVFLHYTGKNIRDEEGEGWKGRIRAMHAKRNR